MTTSPGPLAWQWRALAEVRVPAAALAFGPAARLLLKRVASTPAERRSAWMVTVSDDALVVLGADLPWAEGVRYAAPHPAARGLWLPTNEEPDAPADLLWAALSRHTGREPLLLWREPSWVLPLDRQAAATDELLRAIADRWSAKRS